MPTHRYSGIARLALIVVLVGSGVAWSALGTATTARVAFAECNPPRFTDYNTTRHLGVYKNLSNLTGVQSRMNHYDTWVDPISSFTSSTSAWVMVRDVGTSYGYAQIGWLEIPGNNKRTFTETRNSIGTLQQQFHGSSPYLHTLEYYRMEYSSGTLSYYKGSTLIRQNSTWFAPNRAEVAGETHSYDDQMPGAYYTRQHFLDTRVRVGSGSYNPISGTVFNSDVSQYVLTGVSTTDFNIRDAACSY